MIKYHNKSDSLGRGRYRNCNFCILADLGNEVIEIDISKTIADLARENIKNIDIMVANITKLDFHK